MCHFILVFHHCLNIQKMLLRFCIYFVLVLLYAFSLLILFLLFHNLFCIIVLLVKRVNHFDRKKKTLYIRCLTGFWIRLWIGLLQCYQNHNYLLHILYETTRKFAKTSENNPERVRFLIKLLPRRQHLYWNSVIFQSFLKKQFFLFAN